MIKLDLTEDLLEIILGTLLLVALVFATITPAKAGDIYADYLDSNWETQFEVTRLDSIEMWEQPKTQYPPKNLRTEQQMRFSGKNGTSSYESYTLHLTDYDTYITQGGKYSDGNYYVRDNVGNLFLTGHDFTNEIQAVANDIVQNSNKIEINTQNIQRNTNEINKLNQQMTGINNSLSGLNNRMDKLDQKIESGLATVTALTSLHPNPRATEKLEISIGAGMYADNCAGAIGLFYHPNDRVQIMVGGSYGGESQFAGAVGVTFSIGGRR